MRFTCKQCYIYGRHGRVIWSSWGDFANYEMTLAKIRGDNKTANCHKSICRWITRRREWEDMGFRGAAWWLHWVPGCCPIAGDPWAQLDLCLRRLWRWLETMVAACGELSLSGLCEVSNILLSSKAAMWRNQDSNDSWERARIDLLFQWGGTLNLSVESNILFLPTILLLPYFLLPNLFLGLQNPLGPKPGLGRQLLQTLCSHLDIHRQCASFCFISVNCIDHTNQKDFCLSRNFISTEWDKQNLCGGWFRP